MTDYSNDSAENISPSDFLTNQQRKYPSTPIDTQNFSKYLSKILKEQPKLMESINDESSPDYVQYLLDRLKPRLPPNLLHILETDSVACGLINDSRPNAHCYVHMPRKFVVTINSGLRDFNYRVVRAFSTRISVEGDKQKTNVSFEDTCRIIGDIFLWLSEIGSAHGPNYDITDQQFVLANILTLEVNSFFLAHELAHGIYHISSDPIYGLTIQDFDAEQEEFFADAFAFQLLLGRPKGSVGLPPIELSYAAIELSLMIWKGLELFGIEFEGTHPSAEKRLTSIRQMLAEVYQETETRNIITTLAKPLSEIFERVTDVIKTPRYEAFLDRAAKDMVIELDALLTRCTGGDVPDYVTFYKEAEHLFDNGFSLTLSQHMAKVATDFFGRIGQVDNELDAQQSQEARITFQKYKLFLAYVEQLRPDVKLIFKRALMFNSSS
jgi:hypothetical protein